MERRSTRRGMLDMRSCCRDHNVLWIRVGEETPKVLIMVLWREQGKEVDERKHCVMVALEQLYPSFLSSLL